MRVLVKKRAKLLVMLLFTVAILFATAFGLPNLVKAEDSASISSVLYLPSNEMEYKKLQSPIDAYSDESVTAILENNATFHSLSIYTQNGVWNNSDTSIGNFTSLKKINEQTLLYANASILYNINLQTFECTQVSFDDPKGVSFFDVCGEHIVTSHGNVIALYKYDANLSQYRRINTQETLTDGSPVAINSNGLVFYLNSSSVLCSIDINNLGNFPVEYQSISATKMIANEEYVFYIQENSPSVFAFNILNKSILELSTTDIDKDYQLGNIKTPSGISFKGLNLLITDTTLNAVQEFKIENNSLVFTGFAISNGNTAFNRVGANAIEVEQYKDKVACLDSQKLSVITIDEQDKYSRENFINLLKSEIGDNVNKFALGNDKLLTAYTDHSLKLYDLSSKNKQTILESVCLLSSPESSIINDVHYQSGYFYVLSYTGENSNVYKISESGEVYDLELFMTAKGFSATQVAVDVYKNVFLSSEIAVYKYSKVDDYQSGVAVLSNLSTVKKLNTDLGGGLFVLSSDAMTYAFEKDETICIEKLQLDVSADTITSFSMNFDRKIVNLIIKDLECLFCSNQFPNIAISELSIPTEYVTTNTSADISNLKAYRPKAQSNVYKVNKTDTFFVYDRLNSQCEDYLYICSIKKTNSFGASVTLYALAGGNHVALVDQLDLDDVCSTLEVQDAIGNAFTTTEVDGYFLPIITKNQDYPLTDGQVIRLKKAMPITKIKTLRFLDNEFYFASFVLDGKSYSGYIPKAFTVDVLSKDFVWNNYTIETLNQTEVYLDEQLSSSIMSVEDGTQVRVIEVKENCAFISVKDGEDWVSGYINLSAIKDLPSKAVRDILIILVVAISVFGTTAYFLLRKKRN